MTTSLKLAVFGGALGAGQLADTDGPVPKPGVQTTAPYTTEHGGH